MGRVRAAIDAEIAFAARADVLRQATATFVALLPGGAGRAATAAAIVGVPAEPLTAPDPLGDVRLAGRRAAGRGRDGAVRGEADLIRLAVSGVQALPVGDARVVDAGAATTVGALDAIDTALVEAATLAAVRVAATADAAPVHAGPAAAMRVGGARHAPVVQTQGPRRIVAVGVTVAGDAAACDAHGSRRVVLALPIAATLCAGEDVRVELAE